MTDVPSFLKDHCVVVWLCTFQLLLVKYREKAAKYYHNNTKWRACLDMPHKYHKQMYADRKVVKWGVLFDSIYMRGHSPVSQKRSHRHPHPAKTER